MCITIPAWRPISVKIAATDAPCASKETVSPVTAKRKVPGASWRPGAEVCGWAIVVWDRRTALSTRIQNPTYWINTFAKTGDEAERLNPV
jgi:hypothetical protein